MTNYPVDRFHAKCDGCGFWFDQWSCIEPVYFCRGECGFAFCEACLDVCEPEPGCVIAYCADCNADRPCNEASGPEVAP